MTSNVCEIILYLAVKQKVFSPGGGGGLKGGSGSPIDFLINHFIAKMLLEIGITVLENSNDIES